MLKDEIKSSIFFSNRVSVNCPQATLPESNQVPDNASAGGLSDSFPIPQTRYLEMYMQYQQQSNWCWAAVSYCVYYFFCPGNPRGISQCEVVNGVLNQTICCSQGDGSVCNQENFLNVALSWVNCFRFWMAEVTPYYLLQREILAGNPLGIRVQWAGGGAHFLAIDGYYNDLPMWGSGITVKDSIYGYDYLPYDEVVDNYKKPGSKWTHSYFTANNN